LPVVFLGQPITKLFFFFFFFFFFLFFTLCSHEFYAFIYSHYVAFYYISISLISIDIRYYLLQVQVAIGAFFASLLIMFLCWQMANFKPFADCIQKIPMWLLLTVLALYILIGGLMGI
jgi:hypothetical protein